MNSPISPSNTPSLSNIVVSSNYGAFIPRSSSQRLITRQDGTKQIIDINPYGKTVSWISCAILFSSFILYLVACIVVNFVNSGSVNNNKSNYYLGAFRVCAENINVCSSINMQCSLKPFGLNLPNCDEFNTFRVFLILGLSFSFISYLLIMCAQFTSGKQQNIVRIAVLASSYISALNGFISMIIFIAYRDSSLTNAFDSNIINSNGLFFGPAFICAALGWAVALLGAIMYSIVYCIERNNWLSEREGLLQN